LGVADSWVSRTVGLSWAFGCRGQLGCRGQMGCRGVVEELGVRALQGCICNSHECPITSSLLYFLGVHETAMHGTPGQWHPRAPLLRLGCPRAVKSKPPFADRQKGFLLASPLRVVWNRCSRVWMLYWLTQWNEQKTPDHFSSQSAPLFASIVHANFGALARTIISVRAATYIYKS